jgi:Uma2 family endonuclease
MGTIAPATDDKTVLYDVSWETYERLLSDFSDRSSPRLTYDEGRLEITSPTEEHEELNRSLAVLVEAVAEALEIDLRSLGSTTFRRRDLDRGFEPDSCFYVQSLSKLKSTRKVDLELDPPPDLVIEIDISHSSKEKLTLYRAMGVPEVWRHDGDSVKIYVLQDDGYDTVETGRAFPILSAAKLTELLETGRTHKRYEWLQSIREWARQA